MAAVVFTQIGNLFTMRSTNRSAFKMPLFSNPMIWIGILSELIVILTIVYVPFMQDFIGTGPFEAKYWLYHILWIPSLPLVDTIWKYLQNRKEKWEDQALALSAKGELP